MATSVQERDTGQSGPHSAVCVRQQVLLVSYSFYVRLVSLVSVSLPGAQKMLHKYLLNESILLSKEHLQ